MVQGGHGTWRLGILLVTILGLFLVNPVMGSTTLAPRATAPYGITIANKFGYLNVTNIQTLGSIQDFANGTILFNVIGFERAQVSYNYLVHSYGNGTFDLRFQTSGIQPRVTATLSNSQSFTSSNIQVVDYTSNVASDPLFIIFQGLASQQLFNAAVYASFFFGVIITSIGVLYAITVAGRIFKGFDVITGSHTSEPKVSTTQVTIIGLMVIIGFGTMIIIAVFFGNVLKGIGF